MKLSDDLHEALFGDAAIIRDLEKCEADYEFGISSALFSAISLCARYQAVIPEWAADAILRVESDLEKGITADFNEVFGFHQTTRQLNRKRRDARIAENRSRVIGMLIKHRCDDGSFNADEAFGAIADDTGLSRRDIEEIYRRYGKRLKDIPRGNPGNAIHGQLNAVLPPPRRRGRSIL